MLKTLNFVFLFLAILLMGCAVQSGDPFSKDDYFTKEEIFEALKLQDEKIFILAEKIAEIEHRR